jgi:hypothetical protein
MAVRLPARIIEAVTLRRVDGVVCLTDPRIMHHLLTVIAHCHALLIIGAAGNVQLVYLSVSLVGILLHLQALYQLFSSCLATHSLGLIVLRSLNLSLVPAIFRGIAWLSHVVLERLSAR